MFCIRFTVSLALALLGAAGQLFAMCNEPETSQPVQGIDELIRKSSETEREIWMAAVRGLATVAARSPDERARVWNQARVNSIGMKFVKLESGTFTMGPDFHRILTPYPAHPVKISKPFFLCVTETTNAQFQSIVSKHRPKSACAECPVTDLSFDDIANFCTAISQLEGVQYRLPTEAEWEYACISGADADKENNPTSSQPNAPDNAWCCGNRTNAAPVALLRPNAIGAYDMLGNVYEVVRDWYSEGYYSECASLGQVTDPLGPSMGLVHTLRGGDWYMLDPRPCSCKFRAPWPLVEFNFGSESTPRLRQRIGFRIIRECVENKD